MRRLIVQQNLHHLIRAVRYSFAGFRTAYRDERAFRIELFLSIFIFPLVFVIGHTLTERALLIGSWFFVLIMELINTVIEAIIDRIGHEHHPASGKAKDIGSLLVLIASLQATIIWLMVIFHRFNS